jgi:glycosyltransferase involved in cell wall biosynthesis
VEKNLEAFLSLKTPGTKLVVGDGPSRTALERKYPDVVFVGAKQGEELAKHYACADCFVFPSKTDTFGMVMLESLACGVPVAAFPVQGPNEAVGGTGVGVLDNDLGKAIEQALEIPRDTCRAYAETLSWTKATEVFVHHLQPAETPVDAEPAPVVAE